MKKYRVPFHRHTTTLDVVEIEVEAVSESHAKTKVRDWGHGLRELSDEELDTETLVQTVEIVESEFVRIAEGRKVKHAV